jgi:hypothetical protein
MANDQVATTPLKAAIISLHHQQSGVEQAAVSCASAMIGMAPMSEETTTM